MDVITRTTFHLQVRNRSGTDDQTETGPDRVGQHSEKVVASASRLAYAFQMSAHSRRLVANARCFSLNCT